jgi:putative ABC transport system permease protein
VYGVTANAVSQRSRETTIRMIFGAEPWSLLWTVLRQVVVLVLAGVGVGLPVMAGKALSGLLYGVSSTDTATLAIVALLVTTVGLVAGFRPARQATRTLRIEMLRAD